jgi:hypothetical protein
MLGASLLRQARLPARRRAIADAIGLAAILVVLATVLRPGLLLLPTITAGGDTPCHYPTAAWFHERLLPELRLHGWYPGAYLGHPLLLYYFPLPFLMMSALAPVFGMPVAFKLGTALPVFLLPLLVYLSFRLMRLAFPAPLVGAAAALVFLYVEDTPIWGGSIASTLTGEFSYTYGVGFAVLFLGVLVRARAERRGPWLPAAVLALTSYAHGYAVLWAGLTAAGLLLVDPARSRGGGDGRRGLALLGFLLAVAALAFGLAAPSLVPLLADWGYTTPYHDAWIDLTTIGLFPPLLQPLLAVGFVGCLLSLVRVARGAARRGRERDDADGASGTAVRERGRRQDVATLLLGHGALVGAALAAAGPGLGVIDVRFVPLAQLSLALAGAASLGRLLGRFTRADVLALGLVLVAAAWGESRSQVLRHWASWNYSGLEAKELWPAWRELTTRLRGGVADPRVAVEYGALHERAGSIRMYETLPYFSGRSTLEGVYNQAATTTHPVYYLASELFARSPNPFRSRGYSRFDPESALARLRLFNVSEIVAVSPELASALDARADVVREAVIPPYTVFRLRHPGPGYVEPLAFAPVRAEPATWRDASYRWFSRKPANRAHLVFTDDARFDTVLADPWGPPPERPLAGGVDVSAQVEPERLRIRTSRPGHPLLVKVSYHPRWRAEGADGPYLVSPGLMLIVPRQADVTLTYAARSGADRLGRMLFLASLAAIVAFTRRNASRRRQPARPAPAMADGRADAVPAPGSPPPGTGGPEGRVRREWRAFSLRVLPLVLLAGLSALRLRPPPPPAVELAWLDEQASRAFAEERFEVAAEYARHGLDQIAAAGGEGLEPKRQELLCLRGEALLAAGHPRLAVQAFAPLVDAGHGPYRPQALYSGAVARDAAGDVAGAAAWRASLRREHPRTPWARRLAEAAEATPRPRSTSLPPSGE